MDTGTIRGMTDSTCKPLAVMTTACIMIHVPVPVKRLMFLSSLRSMYRWDAGKNEVIVMLASLDSSWDTAPSNKNRRCHLFSTQTLSYR